MTLIALPVPSASRTIAATIAGELEIIVAAHDGTIKLTRLQDIGLPVGSAAWRAALSILDDRYGAWAWVREGELTIVPENERHRWHPMADGTWRRQAFDRLAWLRQK